MKSLLAALLLALPAVFAHAAEPNTATKLSAKEEVAAANKAYAEFIKQALSLENIVDLIAVMDRVIDEGEHGLVDKQPDPGRVDATSKSGLRVEFSATDIGQAIIYHVTISRGGGADLRYDDATKFAALFTDRAGLSHPIDIKEGDKSAFYVQWLINPKEWKKFLKQMQKIRAENRAEQDPSRTFVIAIQRELAARAEISRGH